MSQKTNKYTLGYCPEMRKPDGCRLPKEQCGYPKCDRLPAAPEPKPAAEGGADNG